MIFDALLWLVIAKFAVMVFEDGMAAARGKTSPRLAQRAAKRAAGGGGSGAGRRVGAAFGDYLAGAAEDALTAARSSRRQRAARRRGQKAVNGVLVTLDEADSLFYADCDLCGWTSRGYQIEVNARAAGAEHTTAEHPTNDRDDQQEKEEEQGVAAQPAPAAPAAGGGRGPRLTVIPGGAAGPSPATPAEPIPAAAAGTPGQVPTQRPGEPTDVDDQDDATGGSAGGPGVVHTDDHTYCTGCPTCRPPRWGWACACGIRKEGYDTQAQARDAHAEHVRAEANSTDHTVIDGQMVDTTIGGGRPAADTNTTNKKETTMSMNLEAAGPEEIRAAFATAIETTNERAEELSGVAGVLGEAADRFESLEMAPSTIGHLRDAADQMNTAHGALQASVEELEAALADFNARDGQVAETVADAGNLASAEVLVG